jgi:hypothetical protein
VAEESIVAACPKLPGILPRGGLFGLETIRPAWKRTCPAWNSVLLRRRADDESWRTAAELAFEMCDLGRFDLADPVRFGLGGADLDAFVTYDHMLRQGADPELAAALSRELLWQGAWEITEETAAGLPTARSATGGPAGEIGVRVTSEGFHVRSDRGELSLAEVVAEVEPWPSSEATDSEPLTVLLVADADIPATAVVAAADAFVERGADAVSVLVSDPRGLVGAVGIRSSSHDPLLAKLAVCIDAAQHHVLSAREPWQPMPEPVDGHPGGSIGWVVVAGPTSLERMLDVLGPMQDDAGWPYDRGPYRIHAVPELASCDAWLDAEAAAAVEARALYDAAYACAGTRGSKRRARCARRICERARAYATSFHGPLADDRSSEAHTYCALADSS